MPASPTKLILAFQADRDVMVRTLSSARALRRSCGRAAITAPFCGAVVLAAACWLHWEAWRHLLDLPLVSGLMALLAIANAILATKIFLEWPTVLKTQRLAREHVRTMEALIAAFDAVLEHVHGLCVEKDLGKIIQKDGRWNLH